MPQATFASDVRQEFDSEFLLDAQEIYIFSACRHIVELILAARVAVNPGELDASSFDERISSLMAQLRALAQATQRFDILVPFTPEGTFSPFFWRWFNWWYDYRQGLTADELEHVHRLQDTFDPSALDCRPRGDWLNYRATPPHGF